MLKGFYPNQSPSNKRRRLQTRQSVQTKSSSVASITYAYIGNGTLTNASPNFTITAAGIGTASATRRVLILMGGVLGGGLSITSATIGGIAAAVHYQVTEANNGWSASISAIVPTGTTADVTVVMNGSIFFTPQYHIYTVDNATISAPYATATNFNAVNSLSLSVPYTTVAGSLNIIGIGWASSATKSPIALPAYTGDNLSPIISVLSLNGTPVAGTVTDTVTWSTLLTTAAIGIISFPPAPANLSLSIAGIQATSAQGAITTTGTNAIAGIQAAASQGTIATAIAIPLAGIQAAASQGAITTTGTNAIAGIQAAASQGTIATAIAIPLAGIQAAASQGAVTYSTAAASLELTLVGILATASQGAITTAGSKAIAGIQATASQGAITSAIAIPLAGIQAAASQGAVTYSAAGTLEIVVAGIQATTSQGAVTTTGSKAIAGIQATASQGAVVYVDSAVTNRPTRKILRSIIDTKAIAISSRAAIRSGKATVFEPKVVNATARAQPIGYIGACKPEKVLVITTHTATAITKAGIPASIYQEKAAKIVTGSRVLVTSRLLTVISGMPSVQIIAAAYPDGSLTPIRSGDISYIHTTRYS